MKQERLRIGLAQDAVTHRNTQRSYEQQRTSPDLSFLIELESRGADIGYILTGEPTDDSRLPFESELVFLCRSLSRDFVDAMIVLARTATGAATRADHIAEPDAHRALHDKKIDYRAD